VRRRKAYSTLRLVKARRRLSLSRPLLLRSVRGRKTLVIVFFGGVVALLAGFAGLALADWLLKQLSRKKRRKEEVEEWLV
jgi:hypothetical protein